MMLDSQTKSILTIDLRKLTHSGIGRYLSNIVPGVLGSVRADKIQLLGCPEEIAALGILPPNVTVLPDTSLPHSLHEQGFALDRRIRSKPGERRVLWVPHYNIPLLYSGALVCTIHDAAPLELRETFGGAKRLLAQTLFRRVARHASAILTPSDYSKNRIHALLGVPEERITVTPLGVDRAWPSMDASLPPFHTANGPYFLCVGNLKPNKNMSPLLEALKLMGEGAPRLLIAGKTDGFRTADRRARELAEQLGNRVHLLGAVTDEELIGLYRGAAALVMPSLYEGFGLPVLEAMRYGCPVLSSRATSLTEVSGDAAILFDPRDPAALAVSLREVLRPEVACRLSRAGIAREATFTYKHAIRITSDVLQQSLENA